MIQTRSQAALADQLLEVERWLKSVSFDADLARYRLPESEARKYASTTTSAPHPVPPPQGGRV